ncbi:MAG TPA: FAD-dependent oxidoreductase, partial [Anaerolineales bacterium]|nr:FAD-dependent oxidoreductase [Anaerolineales bacterium]
MTRRQLQTELMRCEYCEEKPCKAACPVNCSPFDFIMAARVGNKSDIQRAAGEIMHANPLGGVCGMVCPDTFCMAACSRKNFDGSINIPKVQTTLVEMAKQDGGIPKFSTPELNGKKVAVVGGGPAGLGVAASLAQMGYAVDIYESRDQLGGMMNFIPDHRLDKKVVQSDIEFLLSLGTINAKTNAKVDDPKQLLKQGYDAVCVTIGLWKPIELGIENESNAVKMVDLLSDPSAFNFKERVAVVGGGATAIDCAITAKKRGAKHVEMFMLEKLSEMPLTEKERQELIDFDIEVNGRIRVTRIKKNGDGVSGIDTLKVQLPAGQNFSPANVRDLKDTEGTRDDFDAVVIAIGMRSTLPRDPIEGMFYAGDMMTGPKTVVQAVASGKNAALETDAYLKKQPKP